MKTLLPLRFRKAGRVWCGGARESHWATGHNRVTVSKTKQCFKSPCFSSSLWYITSRNDRNNIVIYDSNELIISWKLWISKFFLMLCSGWFLRHLAYCWWDPWHKESDWIIQNKNDKTGENSHFNYISGYTENN